MRKNVKIEDWLIAGAYYRLLKDVSTKLYVHLANNIYRIDEMAKAKSVDERIHRLETAMGFENNLFSYMDLNPDDDDVKEIKGHETSVFYGSIDNGCSNDNPVDSFILGYLGDEFPFISKEAHLDHFRIEPSEVVDDKAKKWSAIAEGNAYAINRLEDIIMKIYEKDHKNEEDKSND